MSEPTWKHSLGCDQEPCICKERWRTLVVDPPWPYADGFPSMLSTSRKNKWRVTKQLPYPSMTLDEIAAVPVDALALPDAALFVWATNRYLHQAFHLIEGWNFTYTQTLVWVKDQRSPFVSSVAPNHSEYLLVARRGDHRWQGSIRSNVVKVPLARNWVKHSTKPEAFLDHIEAISPGPYLELFARRQRLGWDTWGNEALNHVELVS